MIRLFGVCLVILVAAGCMNVTVTTPPASGLRASRVSPSAARPLRRRRGQGIRDLAFERILELLWYRRREFAPELGALRPISSELIITQRPWLEELKD
jgi:hypothetical protein